jgi:hypothetical protein
LNVISLRTDLLYCMTSHYAFNPVNVLVLVCGFMIFCIYPQVRDKTNMQPYSRSYRLGKELTCIVSPPLHLYRRHSVL